MSSTVIDNIRLFNLDAEVLEFSDTVESVVRASKLAGVPVDHIVKTLLFKVVGNGYLVVLARGDRRVDTVKLSEYVGNRVIMASGREVQEVLGVEPGAVSPLLTAVLRFRKLVDARILERRYVVCGGGTLNTLVRIRVNDLLRFLGNYEVIDVFR